VTHKGSLAGGAQAYSLAASRPLSLQGGPVTAPAGIARDDGPSVAPNPFSASTTISFRLDEPAPVTLAVYDVAGRRVRTLARHDWSPAGAARVDWDGRRDDGRPVPPGVYFARLEAGSAARVDKVVKVGSR
jgi:flagellar hook assembly protein FlgD